MALRDAAREHCQRASPRGRRVAADAVPGAAPESLSTPGRAFGDRAQDGVGQTHILSETMEGTEDAPPRAEGTSNLLEGGLPGTGLTPAGQGLRGGSRSRPAPRRHPSAPSLAWTPGSGREQTGEMDLIRV